MMERSHKSSSFITYNVFQIPANEYALEKTANYGLAGSILGFLYGIGYRVETLAPKSASKVLVRIAVPVGVTALTGITYGSVLSGLGHYRGKDDSINHFVAGLCAGAIPGSRFRRNPVLGAFYTGLLFGLSACLIKQTYIRNGGEKNYRGYEKSRQGQQLFSHKNDVETRPEFAKYIK